MDEIFIAGVEMNGFGRQTDRSLRSLAAEAVRDEPADAGVHAREIQLGFSVDATAAVIVLAR
jgi:acetyl-CoA acetyltransferase